MIRKAHMKRYSGRSYKNWVSVFACLSFLFLVGFSGMDMSGDLSGHNNVASEQHVKDVVSVSHDHNMMGHDMTEAGCFSFQCHAMAALSMISTVDRDNFEPKHVDVLHSLSGVIPPIDQRPPRYV